MAELNAGTKLCTNCKRNINLASFLMHESFCIKNIVICHQCDEPFNRHQKDDHFEEYHASIVCECGESIEKRNIDSHKADFCRKRQKQCCYCELSLDFGEYESHVEFCGSRTDLCIKCSRYIQLKDFNRHEDSACAFPEAPKTDPKPAVSNTRQRAGVPPPAFLFDDRFEERADSARSLDKYYLNQFVRETSRMSMSMLPCEFCFENFSSHELLKHQNVCESNPTLARYQTHVPAAAVPNDELTRAADAQNSELRQLISEHLRVSGNSRATATNEDSSTDKIPCEFCHRLFSFEAIIVHQTVCDGPSVSTTDDTLTTVLNQYEATSQPRSSQSKISNKSSTSIISYRKTSTSSLISKTQDHKPKIEPRLKVEPKSKADVKLKIKREIPTSYLSSLNEETSPVGITSKKAPVIRKSPLSLMSSPSSGANSLDTAIIESPIVASKPRKASNETTNTSQLRGNGIAQAPNIHSKMGLLPKASTLTGSRSSIAVSKTTIKPGRKPV